MPAPDASGPRRILFVVTSSDVGGTETFLRELVLRLDRRAFTPVVCSLRPFGRTAHEIAEAGIEIFTLGMSDRPRLGEQIRGVRALVRHIDTTEVDLVQSFLYRANVVAAVAARLARRRPVAVAGQRSLYPLGGGRLAALAAGWTHRLSDRVVAVSEAVRAHLIATERLSPERIVVIENGVDAARYVVRREGTATSPEIVVGGVGRLSPEKGFHDLIEGVALARARGLPLALCLVGDGPERPRLEALARARDITAHVRFLGMQTDMPPLYAAMEVFALPSLEEGFPNALLEAMAAGCAPVGTRVGGVPEIIEHGTSGLLVDPGSPQALADALATLAGDPGLRARIATQARRRVMERFDLSSTVAKHAALYDDLLAARRASR